MAESWTLFLPPPPKVCPYRKPWRKQRHFHVACIVCNLCDTTLKQFCKQKKKIEIHILLGTNMSPPFRYVWVDDFPAFPFGGICVLLPCRVNQCNSHQSRCPEGSRWSAWAASNDFAWHICGSHDLAKLFFLLFFMSRFFLPTRIFCCFFYYEKWR